MKDTHSSPVRAMCGCLSWVRSVTKVLPLKLFSCVRYRVIWYREISASPHCTFLVDQKGTLIKVAALSFIARYQTGLRRVPYLPRLSIAQHIRFHIKWSRNWRSTKTVLPFVQTQCTRLHATKFLQTTQKELTTQWRLVSMHKTTRGFQFS